MDEKRRMRVDRLTRAAGGRLGEAKELRGTMPPVWRIRERRAAWRRYHELMDEAVLLANAAERVSVRLQPDKRPFPTDSTPPVTIKR